MERVAEEIIASSAELPKTPMTSPQQPATMENLPDELLSNIFIRLLVKQIGQMRSVSKSWNALLSQSFFVKSHLHRSIHNDDQILLVFHWSSDHKPFTAKPIRYPHLDLANFIKLPVNPQSGHTNGLTVIGSVNGLICSSYDNDSVIHIWNPSLSAVLTLPPYSMPSHEYDYDSIIIYFRFGFDPKTDDYKVVKLTFLGGPPTYLFTWWHEVEIYSMKKGSWESITERLPSHLNIVDDYVCVDGLDGHDGHLHWLGYISGMINSERIVAFDLCSETFSEIPLPDSILHDGRHRENVLGVLSEKLCVMSFFRFDTFEVWVMDEYALAESWVKCHVFS